MLVSVCPPGPCHPYATPGSSLDPCPTLAPPLGSPPHGCHAYLCLGHPHLHTRCPVEGPWGGCVSVCPCRGLEAGPCYDLGGACVGPACTHCVCLCGQVVGGCQWYLGLSGCAPSHLAQGLRAGSLAPGDVWGPHRAAPRFAQAVAGWQREPVWGLGQPGHSSWSRKGRLGARMWKGAQGAGNLPGVWVVMVVSKRRKSLGLGSPFLRSGRLREGVVTRYGRVPSLLQHQDAHVTGHSPPRIPLLGQGLWSWGHL